MELAPWTLDYRKGWDRHFAKFDKAVREKILKKLEQMKQPLTSRGMHASRYQVEEAGQYRIAFIQDENTRTKNIHFIGDHKQYEKWYRGKE
ncbi:MAG TPA: hypothetical protein VJH23_06200 [archaeon]|nr:hypothetical protein [archaeon]